MSGIRSVDVIGFRTLLRFHLRRELVALVCWVSGAAALIGVQSVASQSFYDTPEELAALRETIGANPAVLAFAGPVELLENIGGEIVFEVFGYAAVVVALMSMLLVGRLTRTDEETGRTELIRSARVGRAAPVATALALAGVANLAVAVAVAVTAIATGLPVGGSVLTGVALAGVGCVFAAFTALAAQVFDNPRSVYGATTAALGLAYLLRAVGDVGSGVASWISPIGWAQRTLPYAGDRWWPLVLPLVATAVTVVAAGVVSEHRDFGAGLLGDRPGRAGASRFLRSTTGLAWRLHRGSILAWTVGVLVLAAAYGSFADAVVEFVAENPDVAAFLPGGAADAVNSYLALTLTITALLAAAHGVNGALRARREETSDRVELVVAARTDRLAWFAGHVAMAVGGATVVMLIGAAGEGFAHALASDDPGQIPRLVAASTVYLPGIWLMVGVAVAGMGLLPRLAAALAWTYVAYCVVTEVLGESFRLPDRMLLASPFRHLPQAPLDAVTPGGIIVVTLCAVIALAAGFVGLIRRDLG